MVELGNGALFPHKIGRNCNYSLIKLARHLEFRPEKCNFAAIIRPEKCSNTLIIRPEKCNFADIIRQKYETIIRIIKT